MGAMNELRVKLDDDVMRDVDRWADRHGMTHDRAVVALIRRGLTTATQVVSGSAGTVTQIGGDVQGGLTI